MLKYLKFPLFPIIFTILVKIVKCIFESIKKVLAIMVNYTNLGLVTKYKSPESLGVTGFFYHCGAKRTVPFGAQK